MADIAPASFLDWFGGGFFGVVLLSALHLYPIMYLNVSASLANVDPSLEEAAENMGAKQNKIVFHYYPAIDDSRVFCGCYNRIYLVFY